MKLKIRTAGVLAFLLTGALALTAQSTVQEYIRRADTQYDLYAYNTALNSYNEALKLEPNNAYAMGRKADCYFQLNRPSEALPFYDRAVTISRVDAEIVFRYAQALMQTGDYIGAKRWFNSYAETNPSVGQHYAAMCDYAATAALRPASYVIKPELLNTLSADYCPVFVGNRVAYNSARRDIARKTPRGDGGAGANEIFITQRSPEDGLLQRPTHLLADLQKSTYFNEGPVAYNKNLTKVAFCHNKFVDGTRQIAAKGMEMSLFLADVDAEGKWVSPKPFQYNGSDYAVGFPWLSDDGNTLYFASNMPGGMGGWDLYTSTYNAVTGMWSTPRNLGTTINTPGNEITPYLEGNVMYFSSDWHNGLGGLDVFKAELANNYASAVVNMGTGINSPRDDYGFIYQSQNSIGYLTSNRADGKGNEDIYQVGQGRDEFSILVRDQYLQPIPNAEIDFSACGAGVKQTDEAGRYEFATAKGQANCAVTIRKTGFSPATIAVNSAGERNMTVTLATLPVGSPAAAALTPASSAPAPATYSTITGTVLTEALGSVVDNDTRDPLYSVKVSALPWPSGPAVETMTNYSGQYTLNLEANRAYTLAFSLFGYSDVSTNIFTTAAGTQMSVNQVSMRKAAPAANTVAVDAIKQRSSPATTAPQTYSTPASTPIAPVRPLMDGYSVQLSATPINSRQPDLYLFDDLTKEGNIYTVEEDNKNKIRLGVYKYKSDAEEALKRAKEIRKDAFIVEEKQVDANLAANPKSTGDTYTLLAGKTPALDQAVAAPVLAAAPAVQFAVQVKSAGLTEPLVINELADLRQYGNLYTRPDNGVIRVRVGVWNNQADAELAQSLIMGKGYRDAVVVVEKVGSGVAVAPAPQLSAPAVTPATETPALTPPSGSITTPPASTGGSAPAFTPVSAAPQGALPDLFSAPATYSTPGAKTIVPIAGTAPSLNVEYMVRICSLMDDPTKFDVKKAEKAGGKVDARQSQSGSIVMLLTGFGNQTDATNARVRLHELGFKDAYVVKELDGDGVLRRVE